MDWAYVAGYFDGEGHVAHHKHHKYGNSRACYLVWHNTHLASLEAIRDFIECGKIRGKKPNGNNKPLYGLFLGRRANLLRVIPLLLEHSIIKRDELEALLNWVESKLRKQSDHWGDLAEAGEEEIRRFYWDEKLSQSAIGKRFGVTQAAVKNFMKRHNIPRRTPKEGMAHMNRDPKKWDAFRERQRQRRKLDWQDPEYRKRQMASMRAGKKRQFAQDSG